MAQVKKPAVREAIFEAAYVLFRDQGYNGTTLTATGLGAYIKDATAAGDAGHILIGVIVMSFYVVAMNRFFWRRLYVVSERRFSLS